MLGGFGNPVIDMDRNETRVRRNCVFAGFRRVLVVFSVASKYIEKMTSLVVPTGQDLLPETVLARIDRTKSPDRKSVYDEKTTRPLARSAQNLEYTYTATRSFDFGE